MRCLRNGPNVLKLINTYTSGKEAWSILEISYEGTTKVKVSRLHNLLANESFALGEKISEARWFKKYLDVFLLDST